ncbi:MAG: RND transporter [bacterium]|nr:MAG: RND transporter [bacterium]
MTVGYAEYVIRHRWWIVAGTIIILALMTDGLFRLEVAYDIRFFFSEENPRLKTLEKLENVYSREGSVLFVIAPKKGDVFTRSTLAAIEELTAKAWQFPNSARVDSITNFQHTRSKGDELIVGDLVKNATQLTDDELAYIKKTALSEPLLLNRLISPDGKVTGVYINVATPEEPYLTTVFSKLAGKMEKDFEKRHPDLDVYLTGGVIIDATYFEATRDDIKRFVPIILAIMLAIILLMTGSVSATISTIIVMAASSLTAMGVAGWAGMIVSPPSAGSPVIVLTLAVADSIHIIAAMFQQMREGKTKNQAIVESLRINMQPVFLTSVTTAIGFLSMNFSDAPPFHDLGNMVATGVVAAFFYSILLLPALMSLLPVRVSRKESAGGRYIESFSGFVVRQKASLFWGMIVLVAVLASGIPRIELSDSFIKYFDKSYKFRRDTDFVEDNLTGFNIIEYSLDSGGEGGVNEPDYLKKLEEFSAWWRAQPNVANVISLADTMKRLNRSMHGGDESYYRIPESRELAAQYMLLYEMSLPFGLDMNSTVNLDKSASRFTVLLRKVSTLQIQELERKGNEWLRKNAPKRMYSPATGLSVIFSHISERNIKSMLGGTAFALVMISGILMLALRSFKLGLISLIPNLAPAMMTFGFWGLFVGEVGMAVSVIAAITLGIVVDDTVHFLSKYTRARREMGLSSAEAVRYSFRTVGAALFTTSVIVAAGFLVLTQSGFKINASLGLLTAVTIAFALMADFLFLPPLLMKVDRDKISMK